MTDLFYRRVSGRRFKTAVFVSPLILFNEGKKRYATISFKNGKDLHRSLLLTVGDPPPTILFPSGTPGSTHQSGGGAPVPALDNSRVGFFRNEPNTMVHEPDAESRIRLGQSKGQ